MALFDLNCYRTLLQPSVEHLPNRQASERHHVPPADMPLFGRHRRLPSMDKENVGDLGGNGYTSVCGDFSFASSSVGLSVNQQNVILKLEPTSPLANKFRIGDVIVQVRRRRDSSIVFSCDSTNECCIRLPLKPG